MQDTFAILAGPFFKVPATQLAEFIKTTQVVLAVIPVYIMLEPLVIVPVGVITRGPTSAMLQLGNGDVPPVKIIGTAASTYPEGQI